MRRLLPRSLRARVTWAFALGASLVVGLSLTLLYSVLVGQLAETLDSGLSARAADLATTVRTGEEGVLESDRLAQLYGADGTVLASSPVLENRDLRLLSPAAARAVDRPSAATVSLSLREGTPEPVRVFSQRADPDGPVVTVAASAEPLEAAQQRLVAVLLVVAPVLVAALAAAAWLLVGTALRPVDALTRRATEISTLEADSRLPEVPGDDEIARLARTLDAMLARLRLAFERERAFVDDASHELLTPITVVRGELELALAAGDDPAEVRRSLHNALAETERLSRLGEGLLLLARAQAGTLVANRRPVDLLDLARAEARRRSAALGLRIEVHGDPAVIPGDPDWLRQVITNLAGNSAAAGATTLDIGVSGEPGTVRLEVADDGPGFPEELLDRVFERFVRGDPATHGRAGAGLGLPIVQAVMAAHGGGIEVRNGGPLGGAVVVLRLPLESPR